MRLSTLSIHLLLASLAMPLRAEEYETQTLSCTPGEAATMLQTVQTLGIEFPTNTYIRYDSAGSRLLIRHTPAVAQSIARDLGHIDVVQVQIDTTFIALPGADISAICRTNPAGTADSAAVLALWRGGKGRLMATTRCVTRSGVNAQTTAVREIKYATEYDVKTSTNSTTGEFVLTPGAFETREVGSLLSYTPTVKSDGERIDLEIAPEYCELAGWTPISVAATNSAARAVGATVTQPEFDNWKIQSSISMTNGGTTILGLGPSPKTGEHAYVILTARVLNRPASPQPVSNPPAKP